MLARTGEAERARRRGACNVEQPYERLEYGRETVHRPGREERDALRKLDAEHLRNLLAKDDVEERYEHEGDCGGEREPHADAEIVAIRGGEDRGEAVELRREKGRER